MFKLISKLFGGNNPVDTVVGIVDKFHFSKEERAEFELKMEQFFQAAEMEMQAQVTERWKADMNSDSWLSKNVRPLVLIFLILSSVALIFIDSGSITFKVEQHWVALLQIILITVIAAYFGGRTGEKISNRKKN